jgi:hypothetical protein
MSGLFIVQNGKTEADEGDADADEAGVVAVSEDLPHPMTSGRGDQRPTNTGGKGVAVATMENTPGADHLLVAIALREEGGDVEDMGQTPTTVDPLLTMGLTHSPRLRRRTPRTQHHLRLSRHRTHSLHHPLLDHL